MGSDVLVPRSVLSKGNYEKLKKLADSKSKEKVKVELMAISAENKTLSGKYVSANYKKDRSDLSALDGKELASQFFNATVISAHDFGIFAELDEYGVEGLVPASKLPDRASGESIQTAFPAGKSVVVQIEDMNVGDKKLVLSMKFESRADVSAFVDVPLTRWFEGVVESVSSFGLFVRPAGFDATGLVHSSRVPRDLIAALKKAAPIPAGTNKTDVEALFAERDVVRVRVHSVKSESRRLELSMLPYRAAEEDEDDYVVEGREPEGEETVTRDADDDEDAAEYDAGSTLLWWRGAPYGQSEAEEEAEDEEAEILNENAQVIEGTWRRMFEIDMREDELDFSSKIAEEERKELEEELGELMGLDEDMGDDFLDFGSKFKVTKVRRRWSVMGLAYILPV
jgi:predicted RNA-binding protein with RPS1 domain